MLVRINPELSARIPGVQFAIAHFTNLHVQEHNAVLWQEIEMLAQKRVTEYQIKNLAEQNGLASVRTLQKSLGFDPGRYRPSSEALLRRVLKGQGLHPVNTAVDVNNFCSLDYLLPLCCYDLRLVKGQICIRLGRPEEQYQGIGRQVFQVSERVIFADAEGVMGNSVSDSERTKVTPATTDLLLAIYTPAGSSRAMLNQQIELAARRMQSFNQGSLVETQIIEIPSVSVDQQAS